MNKQPVYDFIKERIRHLELERQKIYHEVPERRRHPAYKQVTGRIKELTLLKDQIRKNDFETLALYEKRKADYLEKKKVMQLKIQNNEVLK